MKSEPVVSPSWGGVSRWQAEGRHTCISPSPSPSPSTSRKRARPRATTPLRKQQLHVLGDEEQKPGRSQPPFLAVTRGDHFTIGRQEAARSGRTMSRQVVSPWPPMPAGRRRTHYAVIPRPQVTNRPAQDDDVWITGSQVGRRWFMGTDRTGAAAAAAESSDSPPHPCGGGALPESDRSIARLHECTLRRAVSVCF